ncbi:MAG: hypothetical protein ACL93V_00715 [Candidatus Electrothrix sp. YB6]
MSYYYLVKSMTEEGFDGLRFLDDGEEARIVRVQDSDIEATEHLLDVQPGTLSSQAYFFESDACICSCGRKMTIYDIVFTALVDGAYAKPLVLHNLLNTQFVAQENPQDIRCSICGATGQHKSKFWISSYGCYATAA